MVIHPEIVVTPDYPTIKLRNDPSHVNLDEELAKILPAQGWGCGTYFNVQFLTHDRARLIKSGKFVVTQENPSIHTSEANPYQPMTKEVYSRKAEQIGDWWYAEEFAAGLQDLEGEVTGVVASGEASISHVGPRPEIKWNPGKKKHEVMVDGEVVFESRDKAEALKECEARAA